MFNGVLPVLRHNIRYREEKEDDFRKNLEEFKSPGFEKLPFECSMNSTAADLN